MPRYFVDPDIAQARTIDKEFYRSEQQFAESREKLFSASWQFIGDSDRVAERGQVYPFSLLEGFLDEPLLLARDQENRMHLLSNVCTHRGNLLVKEPCRTAHLRCKYHGRQFTLNGRFLSMPEFREVLNFPAPEDNLKELPLYSWGKWLFTSLQAARPPASFLENMVRRMAWLPLQEFSFRPELSRDFTVHAHWALYCENFLEGFHIPFVHAGLNELIDFGNYVTELFDYSSVQIALAKGKDHVFRIPESSPDFGKKIAAYYFFVFPNMMFNFYPWGLSVNIVKPISPKETKISFLTYTRDPELYNQGAGSNLDQVELEDEEVVEDVQRGIYSRFYQHGRYSVSREQGTHHFHRIIAGLMD
jgi:choline monooxygenase